MRKKVNVTTLKEKKAFFLFKKNWGSISDDVGVDKTIFFAATIVTVNFRKLSFLRC
jgi:hypothetical protein